MAPSIFQSSASKSKRNGIARAVEPIEDQVEQIRTDIASLAKLLTERGSETTRSLKESTKDVRAKAEDGLHDLVKSGEDLLSELRERYGDTGKQVRKTVREHPVATLGAAAAVGLLIAALLRR